MIIYSLNAQREFEKSIILKFENLLLKLAMINIFYLLRKKKYSNTRAINKGTLAQ